MSKKEEDNHAQNCPSGAHKLSTADDNIFFFYLKKKKVIFGLLPLEKFSRPGFDIFFLFLTFFLFFFTTTGNEKKIKLSVYSH
jgi:hypothetical protein